MDFVNAMVYNRTFLRLSQGKYWQGKGGSASSNVEQLVIINKEVKMKVFD